MIVMGCDGVVADYFRPTCLPLGADAGARVSVCPRQCLSTARSLLATDVMASQFLIASSTAKKYACSLYSGCFLTAARALASRSRRARPTAVSARPFTSGHGAASGLCNWKSSAVSARERGPCAIASTKSRRCTPESSRGSARAHPECAEYTYERNGGWAWYGEMVCW